MWEAHCEAGRGESNQINQSSCIRQQRRRQRGECSCATRVERADPIRKDNGAGQNMRAADSFQVMTHQLLAAQAVETSVAWAECCLHAGIWCIPRAAGMPRALQGGARKWAGQHVCTLKLTDDRIIQRSAPAAAAMCMQGLKARGQEAAADGRRRLAPAAHRWSVHLHLGTQVVTCLSLAAERISASSSRAGGGLCTCI